MSGFLLDVGHGQAHAKSVGSIIDDMQVTLRSITTHVESAAAGWQGSAHAAFVGVAAEWQQRATTLQQSLDGLKTTLQGSAITASQVSDDETTTLLLNA